jgi:hypothetical protein
MVYNARTDRFAMGVWSLTGFNTHLQIVHSTSMCDSTHDQLRLFAYSLSLPFLGQREAVKMNRTVNYSGFVDLIRNPKPSESPSPGGDSTAKAPDELHREHDDPAETDDRLNPPG